METIKNNILPVIGIVTGAIISIWAIMKYIVTINFRLDDSISKNLLERINNTKFNIELTNEFSFNKKFPTQYRSLCFVNGIFIYFIREERLLNAGWQSKDFVTQVYVLRWQKNKIKKLIDNIISSEETINVMCLLPHGSDKIGELKSGEQTKMLIDDDLYLDIENDINDVLNGVKNKTSCLLYGLPGTGKTRLVKYFSQKYSLPIYSVFLHPDYSNLDIMLMFSSIPERSIVLFEDFDNYFEGRKCIIKSDNVKFTFDSILNILDGVYNDYKKCIFIMTCNNIHNIDDSIKQRPSRMKFVREITPPSYIKRLEILEDSELATLTEGITLDKIFFAKSLIGEYSNREILNIINKKVS